MIKGLSAPYVLYADWRSFQASLISSGPLGTSAADGNNGLFVIPRGNGSKQNLTIIASEGEGWEHVSVPGNSQDAFSCTVMMNTNGSFSWFS